MPGAGTDPPAWLMGPFGDGFGLDGKQYLALLYVAFAAYLAVSWAAPRMSPRGLALGIGLAIGLFVLAPPLLSLDVFSYVSYGRLQVEGLNPYDAAPADLPGDEAASRVQDFADAESVYGPVFTGLSSTLALGGVPFAIWALKVLAGLSALALALLAARVAARRGLSPQRAGALVGLNPILLVHGVGGAHNDLTMALGMIAAVWLLGSSRAASAGVAMAGTVAIKAAAAVTAPFLLVGALAQRQAGRLLTGGLAAALLIGGVAVAVYGGPVAESLNVLGSSQDRISRYGMPGTLERASGLDPDLVQAALAGAYVVLVVFLLRWAWRGGDWVRAAAWATTGLLLASAYMTPWYVIWALPLVAVARDRLLLTVFLAFTGYQLVNAVPL